VRDSGPLGPLNAGLAILDISGSEVDSICLLTQQAACVPGGNLTMKIEVITAFAICTGFTMSLGTVAGSAARADDLVTAMYSGVNQFRQPCGVIADDPRLTAAAQRQADDLASHGLGGGHIGSDGSSPQARTADAGYPRTGYTGEIIYWGTGSRATLGAALDWWMESPVHRAVILNCAFTAAGFAIAWDGNKMIAVGDFAVP
jgi:uncharacterized protein YkwD